MIYDFDEPRIGFNSGEPEAKKNGRREGLRAAHAHSPGREGGTNHRDAFTLASPSQVVRQLCALLVKTRQRHESYRKANAKLRGGGQTP